MRPYGKTRFRTLSAKGNPNAKGGSSRRGCGQREQHLSNELSHQNGLLYALKNKEFLTI